jgi:FeS assembly SUF system regulator
MFRISKLADYGVSLLAALAADLGGEPHTARGLACRVGLPLPTVSKILKALSRQGLLVSHRGVRGGYVLARPPGEITVAEIIRALEGPIGMTECAASGSGSCAKEPSCGVRANWRLISDAFSGALDTITLAEMTRPAPGFERRIEERMVPASGRTGNHDRKEDTRAFPVRERIKTEQSP